MSKTTSEQLRTPVAGPYRVLDFVLRALNLFRISTFGFRALVIVILFAIWPGGAQAASEHTRVDWPLESGWLFHKGDDLRWAAALPDGASPMAVNTKWEDAGYADYDGMGWYFRAFELPAGMDGELVLFLGKIDDADEVFVNGEKIGASGKMPPGNQSQWNTNRYYAIPRDRLKQTNFVAVRVYDSGGGGGLYSGIPKIMLKKDYDDQLKNRFAPHNSLYDIPFANGLTSSKLNLKKRCIDSFREHVYSNYDEHTPTRDFCKELFFGELDVAPEIKDAHYVDGSGVVQYSASLDKLGMSGVVREVEAYVFAPFTSDKKKVYYLIKTGKNFPSGTSGTSLRFSAKFQISPNDIFAGRDNIFVQRSGDDFLTFKPFAESGKVDARYENGVIYLSNIDPDNEWVALSVTCTRGGADVSPETEKPSELLAQELTWWAKWHQAEVLPAFKTPAEKAVFLQSTAVLKMAQCREPGAPHGQILASLPPGHWNICWIRDASYALNGLTLAHHFEEAHDAFEFFLRAQCGKYEHFIPGGADGTDYGVGVPYQISVCRYFGNGTEESDGGDDPNIELDGFGLFLWTLDGYIAASGDNALLKNHADVILTKIADVLVHCIEKDKKIIRRESGPWERHLIDNGYNGAKHFSYTSATAYRGLLAAASLADRLGRADKKEQYLAEAEQLKIGFLHAFISWDHLKGVAEETDINKSLDAGAVEAINFGMANEVLAKGTLDVFDRYLKKPNTPGYARNDDGGDYDVAEWVVIDLRIASAFARTGQAARYETLMDWVTAQSAMNHNIIAELYSVDNADYEGAVPMCGFGPGAYIAALFDRPKR